MTGYLKFVMSTGLLFCVCSTATLASLSKEGKASIQTATFKGSYLNVFASVAEVFHDSGYDLENADEWLGLVTTMWKEERIGLLFTEDIRSKISARVKRGEENRIEVKLKSIVQTKTENGWRGAEDDMKIYAAKRYYKKYFRLIKKKLNDKQRK